MTLIQCENHLILKKQENIGRVLFGCSKSNEIGCVSLVLSGVQAPNLVLSHLCSHDRWSGDVCVSKVMLTALQPHVKFSFIRHTGTQTYSTWSKHSMAMAQGARSGSLRWLWRKWKTFWLTIRQQTSENQLGKRRLRVGLLWLSEDTVNPLSLCYNLFFNKIAMAMS